MRNKAVIDTNIWISALLNPGAPRQITEFIELDLFTPVVCKELIDELTNVVNRPRLVAKIQEERANRLISLIRMTAIMIELSEIPSVSRDPKDDVFLACAMASSAEFLVTGDHDLLCLNEHGDTNIISPTDFLAILKHVEPDS